MTHTKSTESLSGELVNFYDQFVEFHQDCSFLCEVFSRLAGVEDQLDPSTVAGISRFSYSVKDQAQLLKLELKRIQERAYTERTSINNT